MSLLSISKYTHLDANANVSSDAAMEDTDMDPTPSGEVQDQRRRLRPALHDYRMC